MESKIVGDAIWRRSSRKEQTPEPSIFLTTTHI
jgi:hypothetical protein